MRARILAAAFSVFMERGYAGASTLEIATRAKASKRELYALFGNKRAMLLACIAGRAARMRVALEVPCPSDGASLHATLTGFGATLLREASDPAVIAVYRLAIQEVQSPEVARSLDAAGRKATRAALARLLAQAQSDGLIGEGEVETMGGRFLALLWGDLQLRLLLNLARPPSRRSLEDRARAAADALLALYPPRRAPAHDAASG